jgi:hypothetical protein
MAHFPWNAESFIFLINREGEEPSGVDRCKTALGVHISTSVLDQVITQVTFFEQVLRSTAIGIIMMAFVRIQEVDAQ